MLSNAVAEAVTALDTLADTDWAALPVGGRLTVMQELEALSRRVAAESHRITASLAYEEPAKLGDRPFKVIADTLRISLAEARRRLKHADLLRERTALSGAPLAPHLPATAVVRERRRPAKRGTKRLQQNTPRSG
jgi:Domain of unknown function (DUF222)